MNTRPIQQWRTAGVCTNCGKPRDTTEFLRCKRCRESAHARLTTPLPNGICRRCRKHPAAQGYRHCSKCLDRERSKRASRWDKRAQRQAVARAAESFVHASRRAADARKREVITPEVVEQARQQAALALRELFNSVDVLDKLRFSYGQRNRTTSQRRKKAA